MDMTRRGFLKRVGIVIAGLPFAGPVMDAALQVAEKLPFVPSNLSARIWAKRWWEEAAESSYLYEFLGEDSSLIVIKKGD